MNVFAFNEKGPVGFALMRANGTGSQIVATAIYSLEEAQERARLSQKEEDLIFSESFEDDKEFLRWYYFVAELVPVEEDE